MMSRVQKGLVAGFAATAVVSVVEAINMSVGHWAVAFPQLLAVILQSPDTPAVGWAGHLVAGVVLGALFGVLYPRLPTDTPESKGILFAVGAFVLMGLVIAPIGGAGMFFMRAGFGSLAWMVASHAVFGIVLGSVYGRLVERDRRQRVPVDGAPAH
jgi:membrane associated rhomboid family serine protease